MPEEWKALFIDPNPKTEGWNSCSNKQLRRAFRNEPMRLDKAIITFFLLEAYAEKIGSEIDVWAAMSIRPAIFYIEQYDNDVFTKFVHPALSSDSFRREILTATFQQTPALFGCLAKQQTATYRTADLMLRHLTGALKPAPQIGPIAPILNRPEEKKKEPCLCESVEHV